MKSLLVKLFPEKVVVALLVIGLLLGLALFTGFAAVITSITLSYLFAVTITVKQVFGVLFLVYIWNLVAKLFKLLTDVKTN